MLAFINKFKNIKLTKDNISDVKTIIEDLNEELKQFKGCLIRTFFEVENSRNIRIILDISQSKINTSLEINLNVEVDGYIECIKRYDTRNHLTDIRQGSKEYINNIVNVRFIENNLIFTTQYDSIIFYISPETDFDIVTFNLNLTAGLNDITTFMFANLNEYYRMFKALGDDYR